MDLRMCQKTFPGPNFSLVRVMVRFRPICLKKHFNTAGKYFDPKTKHNPDQTKVIPGKSFFDTPQWISYCCISFLGKLTFQSFSSHSKLLLMVYILSFNQCEYKAVITQDCSVLVRQLVMQCTETLGKLPWDNIPWDNMRLVHKEMSHFRGKIELLYKVFHIIIDINQLQKQPAKVSFLNEPVSHALTIPLDHSHALTHKAKLKQRKEQLQTKGFVDKNHAVKE